MLCGGVFFFNSAISLIACLMSLTTGLSPIVSCVSFSSFACTGAMIDKVGFCIMSSASVMSFSLRVQISLPDLRGQQSSINCWLLFQETFKHFVPTVPTGHNIGLELVRGEVQKLLFLLQHEVGDCTAMEKSGYAPDSS